MVCIETKVIIDADTSIQHDIDTENLGVYQYHHMQQKKPGPYSAILNIYVPVFSVRVVHCQNFKA